MEFLKKNWIWLLIILALALYIHKMQKKTDVPAPNLPKGVEPGGGIAGGIVADVAVGANSMADIS